jgi:hypothetical protein
MGIRKAVSSSALAALMLSPAMRPPCPGLEVIPLVPNCCFLPFLAKQTGQRGGRAWGGGPKGSSTAMPVEERCEGGALSLEAHMPCAHSCAVQCSAKPWPEHLAHSITATTRTQSSPDQRLPDPRGTLGSFHVKAGREGAARGRLPGWGAAPPPAQACSSLGTD